MNKAIVEVGKDILLSKVVSDFSNKLIEKKEKLKSITPPDNPQAELLDFNHTYSVENLAKTKEETIQPMEQLADSFETGKNNIIEPNEEVIEEIQQQTKEISKPTTKTKEIFKKGDVVKLPNILKNLPTPAGITMLLVVIFFILFSIQKVTTKNGEQQTRFSLMFGTLLGNRSLNNYEKEKEKGFWEQMPSNPFDGKFNAGDIINPNTNIIQKELEILEGIKLLMPNVQIGSRE